MGEEERGQRVFLDLPLIFKKDLDSDHLGMFLK